MFVLSATKVLLSVDQSEVVTSGSVNVNQVQFIFDEAWDGLDKTAVFQAADDSESVILDETGVCNIPWEVLENPRRTLYAGVYGTKDGSVVLPTVWASLGTIKQGTTTPGGDVPPTPDVYSQILSLANEAKEISQEALTTAEDAKEGASGSAAAAQESAEAAEKAANEAADAKADVDAALEDAQDAATGAAASAQTAATAATNAEAAKTAVENMTVSAETLEAGQDVTVEKTENEDGSVNLEFGIPQGPPGQDGVQIDDTTVNTTDAWSSKKILDTLCPPLSVSGNPVVCYPVEGYPLSVNVEWTPTQEGTGDPSPDNVRAIVGRESVSVTRCKENMVGADSETVNFGAYRGIELIGIRASLCLQLTLKDGKTLPDNISFGFVHTYWKVNKYQTWAAWAINSANSDTVVSPVYSAKDDRDSHFSLSCYPNTEETWTTIFDAFDIMLTVGTRNETPPAYQPYTGTTQTITLPRTIYGGNAKNDGSGEETWGHIASYNGETLPGEWISNRDVYADGTTPTIGAEVAYKLATPNPITITPFSLPALAGTNTVYTDADTVEVEGRADPNHTIDALNQRIAALENKEVT